MTAQHLVQEPHDLPGTMEGFAAEFQSSPKYSDAAGAGLPARAGVPARPALLRFASPI
jgi:hypothetical protein